MNIFPQISLKKKITILLALFPLVMAAIVFFVVIPSVNDIKAIKNEIEEQRIDLEIKYKKGQSLKKLSENLKTVEPQIAKLDKIFINEDTALDFITTMEKIANDNRVAQNMNLLSSKSAKKNGYKKMPLQITAKGDFVNLLNYLIDLEALDYYVNVNSLEMTSFEQAGKGNVKMLIFADTYWE